jgi:general secretion pathway protein E
MADARILTAPGEQFELPEEYKPLMCLYSDGRFLVAQTHLKIAYTRSLEARAKRALNIPIEKIASDIETIRKAYESANGARKKSAVDATKVQKDVTELLVRAFQARASDVHIRVSKREHTSIWMRILGDLTFKEEHSFEYGERLCSTIYMAMADVADTAFKPLERQDARIGGSDKLPVGLHGVRIATTPTVDGFLMVLRLLYNDTSSESLDLTALGYTATHDKAIQTMKNRPTGINIIAGPTGSGKSTTLQRIVVSFLKERQYRIHIITVEDPPEYPLKGAVQTPVTSDGPENRAKAFSAAISAAMRLDPDTIMIGEVREKSSARLAVQAAMTGHQVWTTVHANNAMGILDRMIDLLRETENPNPLDLIADPNIISGLICQRLAKVLCPLCKKKMVDHEDELNPELVDRVRKAVSNIENVYVRGEGCEKCNHAGVKGRSVVGEVIAPDMNFMLLLKEGKKVQATDYWKMRMDGRTMVQHAISKIEEGILDPSMAEETVGPISLGDASVES